MIGQVGSAASAASWYLPPMPARSSRIATTQEWTQAAHRNVLVYNGQMTVSIANAAGLYIDKMEITLDSADENTVTNWNFEDELSGWRTDGSVDVTNQADTGSKAARLGDQARLYQTISVEPDTDYIATARVKVDREDTFSSVLQYSLDGTTKLGMMVTRQSTGNRINLGVMDADSVVLRQAPASTADYTLSTIAFHTGKNQTQAVIYLNTQYDDAYKESVTVYENTIGTVQTCQSNRSVKARQQIRLKGHYI